MNLGGTALRGKVSLVTGASKGIGAEIALQMAEAGADVVVNYLSDHDGAAKVVAQITERGGRAIACCADVGEEAGRRRLVDETLVAFGRIDVLVNNAGAYEHFPLVEVTEDKLEWMFRVNVFGLLLLTRDVASRLTQGGCVLNISSLASTRPTPRGTIYSATKAAVDSITRSLAM